MFNIGQLPDTVSSPLEASGTTADPGLQNGLGRVVIDQGMLEALDVNQVLEQLGQNGIDISALTPDQIIGLLEQLSSGPGN